MFVGIDIENIRQAILDKSFEKILQRKELTGRKVYKAPSYIEYQGREDLDAYEFLKRLDNR